MCLWQTSSINSVLSRETQESFSNTTMQESVTHTLTLQEVKLLCHPGTQALKNENSNPSNRTRLIMQIKWVGCQSPWTLHVRVLNEVSVLDEGQPNAFSCCLPMLCRCSTLLYLYILVKAEHVRMYLKISVFRHCAAEAECTFGSYTAQSYHLATSAISQVCNPCLSLNSEHLGKFHDLISWKHSSRRLMRGS